MTFEEQDCITCSVRFGVPVGFTAHRRGDRQTFYCPNGHAMSYTQSEADKLRLERDRLKQDAARLNDDLKAAWATANAQLEQRKAVERQVTALKGIATKLRKRAAGGACPCCNRTFGDLARHMHTKHPNFAKDEVSAGETIQ